MKEYFMHPIRFFRHAIRSRHFAGLLFCDIVLLVFAHVIAYLLRFEGVLDHVRLQQLYSILPLIFYKTASFLCCWPLSRHVEIYQFR